jgi:hypothetical protein
MTCEWCGECHAIDRLCQRAQRGMTRRSFCFLFGAGIAAASVGVGPSVDTLSYHTVDPHARPGFGLIHLSLELIEDAQIDLETLGFNRFLVDGKLHRLTGYWEP